MEKFFVAIAGLGLCVVGSTLWPIAKGSPCPGDYFGGYPQCRNIVNDVAAIAVAASALGAVTSVLFVISED